MSPTAVRFLDGTYSDSVNPQWVKPLNILPMNAQCERCTASGVKRLARSTAW